MKMLIIFSLKSEASEYMGHVETLSLQEWYNLYLIHS